MEKTWDKFCNQLLSYHRDKSPIALAGDLEPRCKTKMFMADLKGKLTIHEDVSEDFLTSSVFSTFDFLQNIWLRKFLMTSTNLDGNFLDFPLAKSKFLFWRRFHLPFGGSVEPDLVILSDKTAFIIEAKFYSGKSGVGFSEEKVPSPDQLKSELVDQIAREYFLGKEVLRGKKIAFEEEIIDISDFFLILVTKDSSMPTDEIEESINVIGKVKPKELEIAKSKIHWTNWQRINPIMEEIIRRCPEGSFERKIASQLSSFLHKRDLILFNGFDFLSSLGIRSTIGQPIFYHKRKRIYWSHTLFAKPIHFKRSNIFYVLETKPYWEDFVECPKDTGRIFYEKA